MGLHGTHGGHVTYGVHGGAHGAGGLGGHRGMLETHLGIQCDTNPCAHPPMYPNYPHTLGGEQAHLPCAHATCRTHAPYAAHRPTVAGLVHQATARLWACP